MCSLLQELKLKDEECERLSKVREQLELELEELTASLFEVLFHPQVLPKHTDQHTHLPAHTCKCSKAHSSSLDHV